LNAKEDKDMTQQLLATVAGGGIGGLAAALALVRQGFSVKALEKTLVGRIPTGDAFRERGY
jgi:salicylate hydroxylase